MILWLHMHQVRLHKLLLQVSTYRYLLQAQPYRQTIFPFSPVMLWIFSGQGYAQADTARGTIPFLAKETSPFEGNWWRNPVRRRMERWIQKFQSTDKVEGEGYEIQRGNSTIKLGKDNNDGKRIRTIMIEKVWVLPGKRDLCNHSAADPHPVRSLPHLSWTDPFEEISRSATKVLMFK